MNKPNGNSTPHEENLQTLMDQISETILELNESSIADEGLADRTTLDRLASETKDCLLSNVFNPSSQPVTTFPLLFKVSS